MKYALFDREYTNSKAAITSKAHLLAKLSEYRKLEPFIVELICETGEKLTIGIGGPVSFVQHTGVSGLPPYLCATMGGASDRAEEEFMISGTPTPIPERFCIPFEKMVDIVLYFVREGKLLNAVEWAQV